MDPLLVQATQQALRQLRLATGADLLTCYFLNPYSKLFWLFFRDGEFEYDAQMHGPLTRPRQTERLVNVLRANNILSGGLAFLNPMPAELSEAAWASPPFVQREGITRSIWIAVPRDPLRPRNGEETANLAAVVFLNFRRVDEAQWSALQQSTGPLAVRCPLIQEYLREIVDQPCMEVEQAFKLRNTCLSFYRRLAQVLVGGETDTADIYHFIVGEAARLIEPVRGRNVLCWLAVVDANNVVEVRAASPKEVGENTKPKGGIVDYVAHSGQVFYIPDIKHYQEQCTKRGTDASRPNYLECHPDSRSELACPLIIQEKVVGVINIEADAVDAYEPAHILMALQFASLASLAVRQATLWRSLDRCLDAQPDVLQGAVKQSDEEVLQATLSAVRDLGYDDADIWDFETSPSRGWLRGLLKRTGPREKGYTNWMRQNGTPIALADMTRGEQHRVSFSLWKGQMDAETKLFVAWERVPEPPYPISPELLREMDASPPVLTDLGFPIYSGLGAHGEESIVRAVLWAKCRRHFNSVLRDDIWTLSVLARSASMALGIRKRLHSQAQPVRKAFLDWHFGPDRATQVNEALDNDKNLLQPRVAPDVVVLHIDIRGSTDLGVNLKAAGQSAFYVGFIDAYHNASYEEAFQRCGVVDKTMGDGVQLLFNVFSPATLNLPPFPGTINAKRQAIETTLAIFRRFREILVERRKSEKWDYQPDLSLGAGLVAGEAYVGSFAGVDMAGLDFTVLGAPPNAAGKLVGEARPGVLADWIDTGVKQQYIPLALNTGAEVAMDQVAKLCERLRGEPPVSVLLAGLDFCDAAKGFRDCYQVRCPRSKKPYVLIVA